MKRWGFISIVLFFAFSLSSQGKSVGGAWKLLKQRPISISLAATCKDPKIYEEPFHSSIFNNPRLGPTLARYFVSVGFKRGLFLPYLYSFVPQGIDRVEDNFYVSYYHKNSRDSDGDGPSIVVRITDKGSVRDVFELWEDSNEPYTGHVGGAAFHDGALYVPSGAMVHRFRLPTTTAKESSNDTIRCTVIFRDKSQEAPSLSLVGNNSGFSFLSVGSDFEEIPTLWTGFFDENNPTDILGYRFNTEGNLERKPHYIFSGPDITKLQGVTLKTAESNRFVFYVSRSYGDNPSKIYRLTYKGTALIETNKIYEGPAGVEALSYDASTEWIWTVSESGADYYQNRADNPWNDFYPFLYAIEAD